MRCFWGAVAAPGAVWWAGGCRAGLVTFGRWSRVTAERLFCSFVDDVRVVPGEVRSVRTRLGVRCGVGWRWGLLCPEADGRWSRVAGAGGLARLLDRVAVVPGAFDRAQAAAVPSFGIGPVRDLGQDRGQSHIPVFRGGKPPFRWRYGGPVAACG